MNSTNIDPVPADRNLCIKLLPALIIAKATISIVPTIGTRINLTPSWLIKWKEFVSNIKVDFFCDTSQNKQKIKVNDIEVVSPESLDKLNKETNIFSKKWFEKWD